MSSGGPRMTLGVSLWDGQVRGTLPNTATLMAPAPPRRKLATPRELFVDAYARFAATCRVFDEPGLAVIAVDESSGRPAGIVKLCARVKRPVGAIVGRHDRCDLYLQGREELSLRQLAVVLEPVTTWERGATNVRYRILDLRTQNAMSDEDGNELRGLVAEGPAIVRVAGYCLFALPLGDPTDWPDNADDAWAMLPARVYLDELDRCPRGSLPRMPPPRGSDRETFITRTGGPRDTMERLAQGDGAGVLELSTPQRQLALTIGENALKDGVLLGRYGRCDAREAATEDESLSRVHALLIRTGERLLLVDTASSNGTFEKGQLTRLVVVERDTELRLGKRTFLRWRWL
ncbi:MAG: FHA domain-containing protein [Kofleriaceae bacterium]|nr:FHA domain-containing protein [Kofleriaceae bacterium]